MADEKLNIFCEFVLSFSSSKKTSDVRLMAALYSYNPLLQSPNADAGDAELAFEEGDIIQVRLPP